MDWGDQRPEEGLIMGHPPPALPDQMIQVCLGLGLLVLHSLLQITPDILSQPVVRRLGVLLVVKDPVAEGPQA